STPIPCNQAEFVRDVTIPDNTELQPGQSFTKTWRLRNIGSCAWTTGYSLVFLSGDAMGGASADMPQRVEPGSSIDLSVNLIAPNTAGTYKGNWMLRDRDGRFGIGTGASNPFWVQIKVVQTATSGIVYNFASNYCSADWTSGAGDLDCPGDDSDDEGFVIRLTEPDMEHRQENEPGIWTRPEETNDGYIRGIFPAFRILDDDRFRADIGCLDGSEDCDVIFELSYRIGGGGLDRLGEWHEVDDNAVTRIDIDLSGLAGRDVEFVLTVRSNGSPADDDAFWLMPQIYRPD
ncbi:MAG TPA: NBR1-Ig-like domain-containing protein, partial [Anaerolineales bacterium]|nr:NBR1-Ig-like domain-containing protein [Anaerolineales bacterium]